MGPLIRIFFPLIGYFCVATVITLTVGYGYLRHSGAIDNESMFQIVSLLHGVDLDEIAAASQTDGQDIPSEEMSFENRQQHKRMAILHLQAKKDDIEKNIQIFQSEASTLNSRFVNFEKFSAEVKQFLEERREEAAASGLVGVGDQWKNLNAKKQTKPLLVKMIEDGQIDTVIDLLNGMPPKNRTDILKTFDSEEDVNILFRIQQQMLTGGPEASFIDNKLQELNQIEN